MEEWVRVMRGAGRRTSKRGRVSSSENGRVDKQEGAAEKGERMRKGEGQEE